MNKRSVSKVLSVIFVATMASAPALEAAARERTARGQVQTQRGVFKGESTVKRGEGVRTRNSTVTGPNGGQSTVSDTRKIDRAAGTANHDRTRVFRDGTTRTVDADHVKTGEGAFSSTRQVTGRNGETRSQSAETTVTRNDNGRSIGSTIQTQNQGEVVYGKDIVRTDNGRTVTSTATFEDGTTRQRASTTACAPGAGCTTTGAFTGRGGQTVNSTETRMRTEDGYAKDRTTTFPDGASRQISVDAAKGEDTTTFTRSVTGRDGEVRTQTGEVSVTRTP